MVSCKAIIFMRFACLLRACEPDTSFCVHVLTAERGFTSAIDAQPEPVVCVYPGSVRHPAPLREAPPARDPEEAFCEIRNIQKGSRRALA